MEYPYIGRYETTNTETVVLFLGESTQIDLLNKIPKTTNRYREGVFTNITREYLEGKCVKIESPEHSEFVQKLAFNNDVLFHVDANYDVIYFYGLNDSLDLNDISMWTVITIPLPPKSEPKEWPQVGDEVSVNYEGAMVNATVCWQRTNNMGSHVSLVFNSDFKSFWCKTKRLKKPKTEAEILRNDILDVICESHDNLGEMAKAVRDALTAKYNITKKVQE